jgi:hypothetical protein
VPCGLGAVSSGALSGLRGQDRLIQGRKLLILVPNINPRGYGFTTEKRESPPWSTSRRRQIGMPADIGGGALKGKFRIGSHRLNVTERWEREEKGDNEAH